MKLTFIATREFLNDYIPTARNITAANQKHSYYEVALAIEHVHNLLKYNLKNILFQFVN